LLASCQGNAGLMMQSTVESNPVESFFDIWTYVPPTSDDPMAICNIFPDPYFALEVASVLHKKVTDVVTYETLARYIGELDCGPSPLKSIEGIHYLSGLTAFSCAKNDLKEIPAEFGQLINLESVNLLKAFNLETIPPEIGNLQNLQFLRLDLTNLKALPKEIGKLKNLKVLNISNTKIVSLPDEIGDLENLEFLDMHSNDISNIPESICNLAKLKALDIGHTKLESLPMDIGNLTELVRLDLFGCQLKTLPSSLKDLKQLRYFNVYDNFGLDERYKKWFSESVYTCTDDPADDAGWISKWYYNKS
jgi:Leucine-rich repeat (LRR) protein